MRVRRLRSTWISAGAGLALGSVLLSGCGGGPDTGDTEQSAQPTAVSTTPEGQETPEWRVDDENGEPVLAPAPPVVEGEDVEGAEKAAQAYLQSFFDGLREQSSQAMRENAVEGCTYCAARIKEIDELSGKGYTIDVRGEPVFSNVETVAPHEGFPNHIVVADFEVPVVVATDSTGSVVDQGVQEVATMAVGVVRTEGGWRTVDVERLEGDDISKFRDAASVMER